jgi:endo-1,4-beta-D-glucanase Y
MLPGGSKETVKVHTPARVLLMAAIPVLHLQAVEHWMLWESYASRFMTRDGRIVDPASGNRTSSEAQAYGMFFALVANDRKRFEQLLDWSVNNLAGGDLSAHLPAWNWGQAPSGSWEVLDRNSASDADLWMAYTLLEAGKAWREPRFTLAGQRLADLIARTEVAEVTKLGTMLLPGFRDFKVGNKVVLNPSYTPMQVLLGIAAHCPQGPWRKIAANVPRFVKASAPRGVALDWVSYGPKGIVFEGPAGKKAVAGYDAIRVYLWAGMLAKGVDGRGELLGSLSGMARILHRRRVPPAVIDLNGAIENEHGSVGFSAALIPFLAARGEDQLAAQQKERVSAAWNRATGLYGADPGYYDQNLILFVNGWLENRYRFEADGSLNLLWRESK